MPLRLPAPFVSDPENQANFETISLAWPNRNVGVFSAYRNAALSIPSATTVVFDVKEYDVSGWYSTTTGIYTPQIAGYYRFDWMVTSIQPVAPSWLVTVLLKNGAEHKRAAITSDPAGNLGAQSGTSAQAFANGTTDTFGIRFYTSEVGNRALSVGSNMSYFQGELIAP